MPLWLASYPRSGNTFLRIVLRNRYAVRSVGTGWVPGDPPPRTFGHGAIVHPAHDGPDAPAVPGLLGMATHAGPADREPAVYVVRDGRDALVSHAHHTLTYTYNCPPAQVTPARLRRMLAELIQDRRPPTGSWSQHVGAWTARPNTAIVRFEDLIATPGPAVDRAVARLGLGLTQVSETIPTFAELHAAAPRLFRRGEPGSWSEVFTPELHESFWTEHGATMTRLGSARESVRRAA